MKPARMPWVLLALVVVAFVAGGCRLPDNALDGPLALPLRIAAEPDSIEVDAPTWYAADTAIYLCPTEPPPLPEPGPDREGWTPGGQCHRFENQAAPDGLHIVLGLGELSTAERATLQDAKDWYLLLVEVEGGRAIAAIHSSFPAPPRPAS